MTSLKLFLFATACMLVSAPSCTPFPTTQKPISVSKALRDANVILYYGGPASLHLDRPDNDNASFTLSELSTKLEGATNKDLAIVILGKSVHSKPRKEVRRTAKDLEHRLHSLGFSQVLFKLATGRSVHVFYEP